MAMQVLPLPPPPPPHLRQMVRRQVDGLHGMQAVRGEDVVRDGRKAHERRDEDRRVTHFIT